jgi:hypothetical protein
MEVDPLVALTKLTIFGGWPWGRYASLREAAVHFVNDSKTRKRGGTCRLVDMIKAAHQAHYVFRFILSHNYTSARHIKFRVCSISTGNGSGPARTSKRKRSVPSSCLSLLHSNSQQKAYVQEERQPDSHSSSQDSIHTDSKTDHNATDTDKSDPHPLTT